MLLVKKLIFVPLVLTSFAVLFYNLGPILQSYDVIFSLSISTLIQLTLLSGLISFSGFLFVLFVTLAFDWKIIFPVGLIASILPIFLMSPATGFVLCIGTGVSILITYLTLKSRLKTYLTFEPAGLFGSPIRQLSGLLILIFSFTYFLSINKIIQNQGFQIPDSLIEQALKITDQTQNPQDSNILKQAVKDQVENFIKPYSGAIPAILAAGFFAVLQSLVSFINLLIYPLLWGTFYILEKTGFIKFEVEQRPVKKLVV